VQAWTGNATLGFPLVALVACAAAKGDAPRQVTLDVPADAAAPLPVPVALPEAGTLAVSPAPGCHGVELSPGTVRWGTTDVHQRAALVAAAYHVSLVVLGDGDAYRALPTPDVAAARSFEEALAIAPRPAQATDGMVVLDLRGPPVASPPTRVHASPSGRRVDLALDRADARRLFELLGQLDHVAIENPPAGPVTVQAQNVPSATLLRLLAEAAGDAHFASGKVSFGPAASLGPTRITEPAPACTARTVGMVNARLACAPAAELRAVAVLRPPSEESFSMALVGRRGERARTVVRAGDFVATEQVRVERIDCDAVTLTEGTRAALE